jgi:aspartate/methionine/tyrosine aminotransferase
MTVLFPRGRPGRTRAPRLPAHRNSLLALGLEPLEMDCGRRDTIPADGRDVAALDPAPAGLILTSPSNPTAR